MVVVKPVFGAAGEGILFVSDVEVLKSYDFAMGDVILEEFLALDRSSDGIVLSPAVHYFGSTPVGRGLRRLAPLAGQQGLPADVHARHDQDPQGPQAQRSRRVRLSQRGRAALFDRRQHGPLQRRPLPKGVP